MRLQNISIMAQRLEKRLEERHRLFKYLWPLILYCLAGGICSALMDLLWKMGIRNSAVEAFGPSSAYVLQQGWSYLRMVLSAGAGFWAVRRLAYWELFFFAQSFHRKLEDAALRDRKAPILSEARQGNSDAALELPLIMDRPMLPVLLIFTLSLALGINVAVSLLEKACGASITQPVPDAIPGPAGILLQGVIFGLFTPFVEELLFRGTVFSRMERDLGFKKAALASSALFGLYHGSPAQAVYAFVMGMVFAASYKSTGMIRIPFALHGSCNLVILSLLWTGAYQIICTPGWEASFVCIAAAGAFTLCRMNLPWKDEQ